MPLAQTQRVLSPADAASPGRRLVPHGRGALSLTGGIDASR